METSEKALSNFGNGSLFTAVRNSNQSNLTQKYLISRKNSVFVDQCFNEEQQNFQYKNDESNMWDTGMILMNSKLLYLFKLFFN